ncbi:MAG: hypothetical protein Q8N87_02985 [bacterium]|nr:hypothetical protein [bacterium]
MLKVAKNRRALIEKGRDAEEIALKACQQLKGEGKIRDFRDTGKTSGMNFAGMDIVIYTNEGDFVPVEIKSSWIGVEIHQMRYDRPFVVVYLKKPSPPNRLIRKKVRQAKRNLLDLLENQSRMAGE